MAGNHYTHSPEYIRVNNGYIWKWGSINGHNVLETPVKQDGETCIPESMSRSSYYRKKIQTLRETGQPPAGIAEICGVRNRGKDHYFELVAQDLVQSGYTDELGNQVRVSAYYFDDNSENSNLMLEEVMGKGPFSAMYKVFVPPKYVVHSSGDRCYTLPRNARVDDKRHTGNHCVTVVGHGVLDGKRVWVYEDSYGPCYDYARRRGYGKFEDDLPLLVLFPYV